MGYVIGKATPLMPVGLPRRTVYDDATGEPILIVDEPTPMTPAEQITALKAALQDAMSIVGWAKPEWFNALEAKRNEH